MTTWQIEPLGTWTRPVTDPRASSGRFRATWKGTLALLLREIEHLEPRGAIAVRIDAQRADLRRDGMLQADAKVEFPGVVVSFTSALHGPLSYATDAYAPTRHDEMPGWQANLRAIALSLEALRAVDRYGVTRSGEQYVGWRAIEAGTGDGKFASADEALRWVRDQAGGEGLSPKSAYRAASRRLHPDVHDDPAAWARLNEAQQLLIAAGML